MYTRQYKTKKTSVNSSDTPATNQFAPRRFVVQPQAEEIANNQTPDLQTKDKEKQSGRVLPNVSIFTNNVTYPQPPRVQMKLTIGQPGDKYEQEADRLAADVVQRINAPETEQVQRQKLTEDEDQLQMKPTLQRRSDEGGMAAPPDLEESIQGLRGGGQPLAANIQEPMERAFGSDFSGVKVHTDAQSDQLNQSIQARAFTTGQDIFFRQGEYEPRSQGGQQLLAHELTHTLQQTGATPLQSSSQPDKEQSSTTSHSPIPLSAAPSNLISRDPIVEAATAKKQAEDAIKSLNQALTDTTNVATVATNALSVLNNTTKNIRTQATNIRQIADKVTVLQQQVATAAQAARQAADNAKGEASANFNPAANTDEVNKAKAAIDANADAKFAEAAQTAITAFATTITEIANALEAYATAEEEVNKAETEKATSKTTFETRNKALANAKVQVQKATQNLTKANDNIKLAEEQVTKTQTSIDTSKKELESLEKEGQNKEQEKQEKQKSYDLATQNLTETENVITQATQTIKKLETAIPQAKLTVETEQTEVEKAKAVVTEKEATTETATKDSMTAQAEATVDAQTAQEAQTTAEKAAEKAAEVSAYIAELLEQIGGIYFVDDLADYLASAEYVIDKAAVEAEKAANLALTATDSQKKAKKAQEAVDKAQEAVEQAIKALELAEESLSQAKTQVSELESEDEAAKKNKEAAEKQIKSLKKAVTEAEQANNNAAKAVTKAQNAIAQKQLQLTKAEKTLTEKQETVEKRKTEAADKPNLLAQAITAEKEADQLVTTARQQAETAAKALETAKQTAKQQETKARTAKTEVENSKKTTEATSKDLVTATTPGKEIKDIKTSDFKKIKQEQLLLKGVGGQANFTELTGKEADLDKLVTMFECMGYSLLKECLVTKAIASDFLVNMAKQADFKKAITDLITLGRSNADIATVLEKAKERGQTLVPYADLSKLLKQAHTIPAVNLTNLAFWISKPGGQKASELHTYINERAADLTQIWTGTTCAMPAITPPPPHIRAGDDLAYIIANAVEMRPPASEPPNWGYAGNRTWGTNVIYPDGVTPRYTAAGAAITYTEYDITRYRVGHVRDAKRIIIGSDGRKYYTNDHYGHFSQIV